MPMTPVAPLRSGVFIHLSRAGQKIHTARSASVSRTDCGIELGQATPFVVAQPTNDLGQPMFGIESVCRTCAGRNLDLAIAKGIVRA